MLYSEQQIIDLAPDSASAKAGIGLANASKWVKLCSNPVAVWGDCQGSGQNPYQTQIDLSNLAFKCTCPSRKFPCKHGLGLLLLYAKKSELFSQEATLPTGIAEWIDKRANKLEVKEKKEETEVKPSNVAATQKKVLAREKKVLAGIEELQIWIKDHIRVGIMNIPQQQYHFTTNIVARMNDAQAPGLATLLKKMGKINYFNEGWQSQLTQQLSNIYLLSEVYKNREGLEPPVKNYLENLIGWSLSKEEVLETESVNDKWQILARQTEQEEGLTTRSIWLYGTTTHRFALILDFYHKTQIPTSDFLIPGNTIEAAICFYPSVVPLRAIIKQNIAQEEGLLIKTGFSSLVHFKDHLAATYSQSPFVEKVPFTFDAFLFTKENDNWYLADATAKAFQIANSEEQAWEILALSKGKPIKGFALYENNTVEILAVGIDNKFYHIQ